MSTPPKVKIDPNETEELLEKTRRETDEIEAEMKLLEHEEKLLTRKEELQARKDYIEKRRNEELFKNLSDFSRIRAMLDAEPKVSVFLRLEAHQETSAEGGKYVHMERVGINGVYFHCPRGRPLLVPQAVRNILVTAGKIDPVNDAENKLRITANPQRDSELSKDKLQPITIEGTGDPNAKPILERPTGVPV